MRSCLLLIASCVLIPLRVRADPSWTGTLYAGPATASSSSEIFFHGDLHPDAAMVGLALDRHLWAIGGGFNLEGEGQVTRFAGDRNYTTLALGLGLRYDMAPWQVPASIALFTGPSWADDPPVISMGSWNGRPIDYGRKAFLEYVGAELAVSVSRDHRWNGVVRFYHRSGAFGLWADNADEGSMIGIGIRRDF